MGPDRWQVLQLYDAALAKDARDKVRREVETLLEHERTPEEFLAAPALEMAANMSEDPGQSLTGRQMGTYQILSRLGAGGMGEVYRARDLKLGREVAIKVLPASFTHNSDRLARLEREARMLAALNHPHIGTIYGLEDIEGVRALVLELVEGPTLADRVAAGPTPVKEALIIAQQIAEALGAAHEKGIIHRDLKPANVKVTLDGTVKVLDFGLAKALIDDFAGPVLSQSPTVSGTGEGTILGTPSYMSPEQARGKPLDRRTDIWAFGCVLYEMLTGRLAFPGETRSDTIAAILGRPPDWRVLPDTTPGSVRRLLQRCLEIDQKRRLHDIADARLEVDDALAALTRPPQWIDEAHSQATGPITLGGSLRRLRARILAVSCGFLLLLTGATWGYVRVTAERAVGEVVEADLARAERVVRRLHEAQLARLGLTARLVASFPEFKALLATDAATIQDFLLSYQQRIPGTPLLVALGPDGTVLGRTDDVGAMPSSAGEEWPAALVTTPGEGAVVAVGDRPYFAVAVASEALGTVFGYLVAAEPFDQTFAAAVSEATQDEVVLLSRRAVLASTLRAAQTPWRSLDAWHEYGGRADRSVDVRIGPQRFAAREVTITSAPAVSAIIVKSRDETIGPFLRIQRGLAVIGLLALAAAILGGVWFSRMFTVPR